MPEDERKDVSEEMNEENDAREEDIVEDVDADTKDVERNNDDNYSEVSRRLDRLETMMEKISGGIDALRDAQSIIVDNGGTIQETEPDSMDLGIDDFVAPAELDLII